MRLQPIPASSARTPPPGVAAAPWLGVEKTLQQEQARLTAALDALRRAGTEPAARLEAPFVFESRRACIGTYVEALDLVRERFWATTFLNSGFWTHRDRRIIEANGRMMARLRDARGAVRRLFLLDQPPAHVVEAWGEQRILLGKLGKTTEIERHEAGFDTLRDNVRALEAAGCHTRVVFDARRASATLPPAMQWAPEDTELALYDDFRVDAFDGGRTGAIRQVRCFSPLMTGFEPIQAAATAFFETLWEDAAPMSEYLDQLAQALDAARNRIDYRANWLARYEYALDPADEALKASEAEAVAEALRARGRWGALESVLDIGTCTGRYLLFLRDAVRPVGRLVGIDNNAESIHFAQGNLDRYCSGDARFQVLIRDFAARDLDLPATHFDLITCMMSTLSHFGQVRNDRFDDPLQAALRRMAGLLAPGGVLCFSTWTAEACAAGRFLSIYHEADNRRLAAWTPSAEELTARLSEAGFAAIERCAPDLRLNLWICERG